MNFQHQLRQNPIAIVGLGAIFAQAENLQTFWQNILDAKDCISDVPESRWKIEDYYDPNPDAPDKSYCKRGGFTPDIDFNPMEFGLPPNILEVTDTSQLLALAVAKETFQDAGYVGDKFSPELRLKTGVVLGVGGGQKLITPLVARLQAPVWKKALLSSGISEEDADKIVEKAKLAYIPWVENSFPGMLGNVIAGRVANRFDLGAINSVVDAACAASLSAIQMAINELLCFRADMMLTGGVDTDNSPFMYLSFSKTPAFSPTGKISPYSDAADGMLIGEGVGMLLLKRLKDAERDGDKIYAVIKGIGASSDGKYKSVYAPRASGQAVAMQRAYQEAGFEPQSIGLIEGHGTGTKVGDATEFESMRLVFSENNPKKQHIGIGSVKSQIGHGKAAAGAAGMIKAALALHHKILPPTINVEKPSSKFNIESTPFYVNTETRPWVRNGVPRRAGVSAFGFGGINLHLALEEYNAEHQKAYRMHKKTHTLLFVAENKNLLLQKIQNSLVALQQNPKQVFFDLSKEAENLQIPNFAARLGFVCQNEQEAIEKIQIALQKLSSPEQAWENPLKGIYFREKALEGKTVALFAGQGSQYVNMGRELACNYPIFREVISEMDKVFASKNQKPLSEILFPKPVFSDSQRQEQQKELTLTQNAQPAIGVMSAAMFKILQQRGFKADFTAGHSFGELTALWAGGVLSDTDFYKLAYERGNAMKANGQDAGTMLAVKADAQKVQSVLNGLQGVQVANLNADTQTIIGGYTASIQKAQEILQNSGLSAVPIQVSAAFHTPLVKHAFEPFAKAISETNFKNPNTSVYSNTTATVYPLDTENIKNILANHFLQPVHFKTQIENIFRAGGKIFVEFGGKNILGNLTKEILKNQDIAVISLNPNPKKDSQAQLEEGLLQLRVVGVQISGNDMYQISLQKPENPSKMNVKLGGNNYVSDKTRQAFVDAINNGHQIKGVQVIEKVVEKIVEKPVEKIVERIVEKIVEKPVEKIVEKIVEKVIEKPIEKIVEKLIEKPVSQVVQISKPENSTPMSDKKELIEVINKSLSVFQEQQQNTFKMFEQFMAQQTQISQSFLQNIGTALQNLETQNVLVEAKIEKAPLLEAAPSAVLPPVMPVFESPKVESTAQKIETPAVPIQTFAAVMPSQGLDNQKLTKSLLEVVAEKTGYPAEMLELSMDMEADLGIDSIKRVEIFGAMTEKHPEIGTVNPQEMGEIRTLGQIIEYMQSKNSAKPLASTPVQTSVASIPVHTNGSVKIDDSKLKNSLLEVVAEKTGYPAEMLELSMDMEADLGIDSIKRVEIFGAMTEKHPEIGTVNPQEMGEIRTLGQIIDYMQSKKKVMA